VLLLNKPTKGVFKMLIFDQSKVELRLHLVPTRKDDPYTGFVIAAIRDKMCFSYSWKALPDDTDDTPNKEFTLVGCLFPVVFEQTVFRDQAALLEYAYNKVASEYPHCVGLKPNEFTDPAVVVPNKLCINASTDDINARLSLLEGIHSKGTE